MAVIGIDLGTTNSLAVAYREDHYELIPNGYGEYLTPSVVSIDDDGSIIVGKCAKERFVTYPQNTAALFKRNMGKDEVITLKGHHFLPEELSSFVVRQLVEDAKNFLHEEIDEVVISVPAYFDEHQRHATKRIGELIGIKVERLINEPSAAAISCHQGKEEDEAFIVFDFGGGTLDVSVVDCFDNVVSICSIAGDNHLGGSDFDKLIALDFCKQYQLAFDKLSPNYQASLLLQCERAKKRLENLQETIFTFHFDEHDYEYVLKRDHLALISESIFQKMRKVIAEAVNNSGFEKDEINKIILVGGSCHMPLVVAYLKNLMNIEIFESDDMDKMVVKGLGIYIGIKQRKSAVRQLVLTDICPFSLSNSVHNEAHPSRPLSHVQIPRNTVLPASNKEFYYTITDNQDYMNISVYQGESVYADENDKLAQYRVPIPKNKAGVECVAVTFSYDINALLCVDIQVLSTGLKQRHVVGMDTVDQQHIEAIKNISLKLHLEPEIEYIREMLKRILEESSSRKQEKVKEFYLQFEHQLKEYDSNLRKKSQLLSQVKKVIERLDQENQNCEFFNHDDTTYKGPLS